jgi:hypothetical protein
LTTLAPHIDREREIEMEGEGERGRGEGGNKGEKERARGTWSLMMRALFSPSQSQSCTIASSCHNLLMPQPSLTQSVD